MKKTYISWEQYGIYIDRLTAKVKQASIIYDGVYAVRIGSLPIAVAMSTQLDIPIIFHPTSKSLVVDNLFDKKNNASDIKHKSLACICIDEGIQTKPDFYVTKKETSLERIIFPYQVDLK